MPRQSWWLRAPSLTAVVAAALLTAGASGAGVTSRATITAVLSRTPAPQVVTAGQELAAAERAAAGIKGAVAFLGVGDSMLPLYSSNTAVVAVPTSYDRIKKGMTVVYLNRHGLRVAHTVVDETTDGYLVQGLGNDEPDRDVVNEMNLVGVIVGAFASHDTTFRHEWVARLKHDPNPSPQHNRV